MSVLLQVCAASAPGCSRKEIAVKNLDCVPRVGEYIEVSTTAGETREERVDKVVHYLRSNRVTVFIAPDTVGRYLSSEEAWAQQQRSRR